MKLFHKTEIECNKEQHNTILNEIEKVNLKRMQIMLPILCIVEIMFILFNDLQYYINSHSRVIWAGRGYFIVHLLLMTLSIVGLYSVKRIIKNIMIEWKRVYYYYTCSVVTVYLLLIGVISALDQIRFNNISSLFIANLLICGGIFFIDFPKNMITFTTPFICYSVSFFYFEPKSTEIFPNLLNGVIFLVAVIVISSIIYNYQYDIIAKNIALKNNNIHLDSISNYDSLTGLINRRYFMEQLESKLGGDWQSSSIVLADIDHFKLINDLYGHPAGDEVLKEVSAVILKSTNGDDMAVRWGGEEFLLFLYNSSLEEACIFVENLRKNIEKLQIKYENYNINVTVSFGVSLIGNSKDNSFDNSYKIVDWALYQAKKQGRNCVVKAEGISGK